MNARMYVARAGALAIASLIVISHAGGYTVKAVAGAGSVSGVVRFADEYPKSEAVRIDTDAETCGVRHHSEEFLVDPGSKGLGNVVAILQGLDAGKPFPETELKLDQVGCRYEPHVQVGYRTDSTEEAEGVQLIVVNSDDVFHNVHAYEGGNDADATVFNTPSIPEEELVKDIAGPGVYSIRCDVHSWMSAWIIIEDHPYVAISDEHGTFSIDGVPPGSYTLRLWHEGLGEIEREVEVSSGEDSFVDLTIGE